MLKFLVFFNILLLPFALPAQHVTFRGIAGHNSVKLKTVSIVQSKISSGQIIGLAFGYQFNPLFRAEVETSYRTNAVHKFVVKGNSGQFDVPVNGKLESAAILCNAIFTPPFSYFFQPYIGVGAGTTAEYCNWSTAIIENHLWYDFPDGKRLGMSYQIIAGVHLPAHDNIYCGVEYRLLDSILDQMTCCNRTVLLSVHKQF